MDRRKGAARLARRGCWVLPHLLAASLAPIALTSTVSAQPAPPESWLEIERGPGSEYCPNADTLAPRVLELVTHPPEGELPRVRIVLRTEADSLRAQISMRGRRSGERELSAAASSCDELAEALVVALALMLDPSLPGVRADSAATSAAAMQSPPPPKAANRAPPVESSRDTLRDRSPIDEHPTARKAMSLYMAAGGSVSQVLDGLTPGGLFGAEVERDGWYASAHAIAMTRTVALGRGSTSLWLLGGQTRAGGYWLGSATSLRWGGAAVLAAAALSASAEGYRSSSSATRPWIAGGVATVLSTSAKPTVSYRMSVAALVPFLQDTFVVENVGPAYGTPTITLWVDLAIAVRVL